MAFEKTAIKKKVFEAFKKDGKKAARKRVAEFFANDATKSEEAADAFIARYKE